MKKTTKPAKNVKAKPPRKTSRPSLQSVLDAFEFEPPIELNLDRPLRKAA